MMYHQPQRNQMPYAPVCYPNMPPQMYYGDYPARLPTTHGQWPSDDGSHGYVSPPVHCHGHGCCTHNNFPLHFATRPPYPHHQYVSPSPMPSFYPSCYPAGQGMYPPAPYFPPHQYEYDKDMSCCGWRPYHPSNGKQEKHVKIEEEEPEMERKTNCSLVPFEAKNYPYPLAWLQPNKETEKPDDSRYKGRDKILGEQADENPKSFPQQPILWNGWFPYDMSRLQSSNQEEEKKKSIQQHEEGKSWQPNMWRGWLPLDLGNLETMKQGEEGSNQQQKDIDKKRNFPFPFFWMPYQPSVTERGEEPEKMIERGIPKKTASGEKEVPSHIVKFQPEKHIDNKEKPREISKKTTSGEGEVPSHMINFQPEKHKANEEKPEIYTVSEDSPNLSNTHRVVKIIPVKQLETQVEGNMKTSSKIEDEREKKPVEDCANKESTSARKTSKLPPVCLRIDPLPKRKVADGKSRSPSPPANKRKLDDASGKKAEPIVLPNSEMNDRHDEQAAAAARDRSKEETSKITGTQAAGVAEQVDTQEGEVKLSGSSGDTVSHADATRRNAEASNGRNEEPAADSDAVWRGSVDLEAEVRRTDAQSGTTNDFSDKVEECEKVKFSDAEAATMIQAAYHGFEVRKLGTLKKLKKLAEIKEQMDGIKSRIQALESSCDVKNDKQKTIVTEMIMGLLLKLDAVQGLHSSIRDVRKSIAKELVSLQESLDALVNWEKSSEAQLEQPSGISIEESMPKLKNEGITLECQRKDNGIDIPDLSKNDHEVSPPEEIFEKQVHETDSLPDPEDLEKSDTVLTKKSVDDEARNVPGCTSTEYFPGASESAALVGGSKKEQNDSQSPMADCSQDDEELELEQLFEGQDLSRELSSFVDVSKEEIGKETSNILALAVNDKCLYSEDMSDHDPSKRDVPDDAVTETTDVDEVIILNQEQQALEENHECKEEEKMTHGTHLERPHESCVMSMSPLLEQSGVDTPIEVPNESTSTCEADEVTCTTIPIASTAADSWKPDLTVSPDLSGLGQQVDVFPEDQKEQSLIEVSDLVHDEAQFKQGELHDENHGWKRDTGSESGNETAVPQHECPVLQHECLNGVSSIEHDALPIKIQKEDHEEGVYSLSDLGSCNDETSLLLTPREEEVTDGLEKECGHLDIEESRVKEELPDTDYVFVSGGSDVYPDSCIKKSEEVVNIAADEMENISPVVTTLQKMDATCLAPEEGSERTKHVAGTNNQPDELDISTSSPTASQASLESDATREMDRKLMEENEKLRDMMEKILEAGSKQLSTISELSGRINDLEKKLARKKKKQLKCRIRPKAIPPREVSV